MSISTITVGGQSVTLVSFPAARGLKGYDFSILDQVGAVSSVFTGQMQTQSWPGADLWSSTLTIAPIDSVSADDWVSFLMELRGMAYAFQLVDKRKATPLGSVAGTPLVDNSVTGGNAAMSTTLGTKGWTPSETGVLKRGDQIEFGYRLHQVLANVDADSSGNASFPIFPSLREVPTDSGAITTSSPKGLWRLAKNQRGWSYDISRLVKLGPIAIQEYR